MPCGRCRCPLHHAPPLLHLLALVQLPCRPACVHCALRFCAVRAQEAALHALPVRCKVLSRRGCTLSERRAAEPCCRARALPPRGLGPTSHSLPPCPPPSLPTAQRHERRGPPAAAHAHVQQPVLHRLPGPPLLHQHQQLQRKRAAVAGLGTDDGACGLWRRRSRLRQRPGASVSPGSKRLQAATAAAMLSPPGPAGPAHYNTASISSHKTPSISSPTPIQLPLPIHSRRPSRSA